MSIHSVIQLRQHAHLQDSSGALGSLIAHGEPAGLARLHPRLSLKLARLLGVDMKIVADYPELTDEMVIKAADDKIIFLTIEDVIEKTGYSKSWVSRCLMNGTIKGYIRRSCLYIYPDSINIFIAEQKTGACSRKGKGAKK